METKICVKCNREFPIENYCFKNKARNIRTARCTECNCESKRESYRKHYITNKKKFEDRRASFKASNYKLINSCK